MSTINLPVLADYQPKTTITNLMGEHGANRELKRKCQFKAVNDWEAVQVWLDAYKHKPATYKQFRKEVERLLLWCIYEQGKALSDLEVEDFKAYLNFLTDPKPYHKWCVAKGKQRVGRFHSHWRPFNGALSLSSRATAVAVINSCLDYLVMGGYLSTNPLRLIKRYSSHTFNSELNKFKVMERILDLPKWEAIKECLEELPETTSQEIDDKARRKFLVAILYLLGLRLNEAATHTWNAFRQKDGAWWFFVKGKGDKPGMVPVSNELLAHVKAYRTHLGKEPLPGLGDFEYLFVSQKTKRALSNRQLYQLVKDLGLIAAEKFKNQPEIAAQLSNFSPHWLRHLFASHQDKAGIPMQHIKSNLRHSSQQTTQIYLHAEDDARSVEIQKLNFGVMPQVAPVVEVAAPTIIVNLQIVVRSKIPGAPGVLAFMQVLENKLLKNEIRPIETVPMLTAADYSKAFLLHRELKFNYQLRFLQSEIEVYLSKLEQDVEFEANIRGLKTTISYLVN